MAAKTGKISAVTVPENIRREALDILRQILKRHEGWHDGDKRTPHSDPVLCPTGYVTVGWGRVLLDPVTGAQLNGQSGLRRARELWPAGFTQAECEAMLAEDMARFIAGVMALLTRPVSAQMLAAMTSLTYNIGLSAYRKSTVLRLHNTGDQAGAAQAFGMWVKGTVEGRKVDLPGLIRRRAEESALYLTATVAAPTPASDDDVPVVDIAESAAMPTVAPITASRTVIGSATAAVATVAGVVTDAQDALVPVQQSLWGLGIDTPTLRMILAGLAIAGALLALYARWSDRRAGRR